MTKLDNYEGPLGTERLDGVQQPPISEFIEALRGDLRTLRETCTTLSEQLEESVSLFRSTGVLVSETLPSELNQFKQAVAELAVKIQQAGNQLLSPEHHSFDPKEATLDTLENWLYFLRTVEQQRANKAPIATNFPKLSSTDNNAAAPILPVALTDRAKRAAQPPISQRVAITIIAVLAAGTFILGLVHDPRRSDWGTSLSAVHPNFEPIPQRPESAHLERIPRDLPEPSLLPGVRVSRPENPLGRVNSDLEEQESRAPAPPAETATLGQGTEQVASRKPKPEIRIPTRSGNGTSTTLSSSTGLLKQSTEPGVQQRSTPVRSNPPTAELRSVQPSFDCGKATTRVDLLICNDSRLASLERENAAAYRDALSRIPKDRQGIFRRQQRDWFKAYFRTCNRIDEASRSQCVTDYLIKHAAELRNGPH